MTDHDPRQSDMMEQDEGTEGQERVRGAKDRERLALMVKAPIRWPTTEQAGIADLPLFGTKDLFT